MEEKKKVVVAFSGGLDTSFTVMYLAKEKGYEVYAACANTGGFSPEQLKTNEENAYKLGAKEYVTIDVTQEYYEKSLKYMVFGNVLRNGTYPISVSSERIFQALAIARYANEIGADAIAHGSTGAGKTVTLQCLGGRLRQQGKRVIIIAPKKGHEFRPLCEKLGGLYLRMSPSSKDCPNLMAIRRKSLDSYAKLKNIAARDDSVLADKISQLIIWFALKKKDLSEEDKSRLDSSLVEVYGRYGITFDNSSIVDENGNFRTMPIISDWYDVLSQNPDTRYLSVVLSRYVTGSAAAMASRNSIDLDNKYIVLDLSGMPDDMIADGTFWATSIAYDLIMSCESDLSALLADELWSLVGATANPQAAGFVLEMVKTIRGLGGIAVTSTQGMQDLFGLDGGSYGKGILDASRIKLVMQMEEQEARLIQDKLNLSEDEVRQITRFRRGEGLLCIGYNHVPVAFHTTPKEYEAITTSPTDLRRGRSEHGDE